MDRRHGFAVYVASAAACFVFLSAREAHSAAVSEQTAVRAARNWLVAEARGDWSKLSAARKAELLESLDRPVVGRIWRRARRDYVLDDGRAGGKTAAYAISFPSGGYVVVAADDRVVPVLAYDPVRFFVWAGESGAVARDLIGGILEQWRKHLDKLEDVQAQDAGRAHAIWARILTPPADRSVSVSADGRSDDSGEPQPFAVSIELETPSWNQKGYYNDMLQTRVGGQDVVIG